MYLIYKLVSHKFLYFFLKNWLQVFLIISLTICSACNVQGLLKNEIKRFIKNNLMLLISDTGQYSGSSTVFPGQAIFPKSRRLKAVPNRNAAPHRQFGTCTRLTWMWKTFTSRVKNTISCQKHRTLQHCCFANHKQTLTIGITQLAFARPLKKLANLFPWCTLKMAKL